MAKKVADTATPPLYGRVREILEAARGNIARTVNTTQVIANWLIGREIVEEEQRGKKRADYGQQLVLQLSAELTTAYGKGWSAQNLFYMRQFYFGLSRTAAGRRDCPRSGWRILHGINCPRSAWTILRHCADRHRLFAGKLAPASFLDTLPHAAACQSQ